MNRAFAKTWEGPFVWDGKQLAQTDDWVIQLSPRQIDDITAAVAASTASGKALAEVTAADFPLGSFTDHLADAQDQLLHGRGFVLIRGLPAELWTDEQLIRAYWGIGQWLGTPVSQNAKAHLLGHVIDQRSADSAATRLYQTNKGQPFHSDSCDIVGLLCLRAAKSGGESSVASSAAIHNALLQDDPQAINTLYGQFMCDRYGEIPEGKLPYYPVSIFNRIDEQLVCCGMDPDIRSAQRLEGLSTLSAAQLHALDQFQAAARKLALKMSLHRGDIQLVNNLAAVHARETFVDYTNADKRRYLIRLWLSATNGRKLPEFLKERWGNIDAGSVRGGIRVPGARPVVQLNPND